MRLDSQIMRVLAETVAGKRIRDIPPCHITLSVFYHFTLQNCNLYFHFRNSVLLSY
jgi:hypothetical protein